MKTPRRLPLPVLAAAAATLSVALLPASPAAAQTATAVTDPVGFTTLTVAAKPADTRGFTYVSLNMARSTVYRALVPTGGVSTVNGTTTLTFTSGTFAQDQFNGVGNACYLEIKNGAASGLISNVTATTPSTITLADDITSAISAGTTTFLIRPHWTFGTAFGVNNSAGFQGSFTSTNADAIQLITPTTNVLNTYYYNTTNNRWQRGGADATNTIIPPNAALLVERKQSSSLSFSLMGDVKLGRTGILIQGGDTVQNFNLVPNPYPLNSVPFANSGLFTNDATTGLVGSFTSTQADTVSFLDSSTGVLSSYYYNTTNNRWQRGGVDASDVVIPAGSAVMVTRKNGRSSFIWYMPQPAMNL